ncbi:MAG: uracil-DNA glycosylase [Thermoanaerobaculia bacterium]
MKPNAAVADLLEYLQDLGFVDLRTAPDRGRAAAPATPEGAGVATEQVDSGSALAALAAEAATCERCALSQGRNRVVFGSGPENARILFVGEGPGAEEDRQGVPFVGAAGELLTKILGAIGLEREAVYIANIVKCRPPGNRDPAPEEVAACRGFLERQIALVRPRLIVALGRVAAQSLLGSGEPLGRLRGSWHDLDGIPLRVTYHPAALLRNAGYKRPTWEDMQLIRDRLHELP